MVAELCDFCAGCEGSIWYSTVQVHSPAILASIACGAPGVAAFVILSIIAFCSADICGGASAAWAAALTNNATITNAFWSFMGPSEGLACEGGQASRRGPSASRRFPHLSSTVLGGMRHTGQRVVQLAVPPAALLGFLRAEHQE